VSASTRLKSLRRLVAVIATMLAVVPTHVADSQDHAPDSHRLPRAVADAEAERLLRGLDPKSPQAIDRIPQLIGLIRDETAPKVLRQQAGMLLGRIGKPAVAAVPMLIRLLRDPETPADATRSWALKSLGLFGELAADAVPQLSRGVSDRSRSQDDRILIADVLGQIGTAAALQALSIELLRPQSEHTNSEALLRQVMVDAVALTGPQAIVALPALTRMTADGNADVRRKACQAIGQIGPRAELSLDPLLERLVLDETPAVRDAAAAAMGKIGPAAVSMLIDIMGSGDAELQWRAARSLQTIGPRAGSAVESLQRAFRVVDPRVRVESLKAVWRIRGDPKLVAGRLIQELSSPERQVRRQASLLLIEIDPLPAQAMMQLQIRAADRTRDGSREAGYVLRERARRSK